MNISLIRIFFLLKLTLILFVNGDRTKDRMYEAFNGRASCFRWLNATHQIGCTSKRTGSVGALHFVDTKTDLEYLLKKGNAGQYMPVLPTHIFDLSILRMLKQSDTIAGLVIYTKDVSTLMAYSHEQSCPNRQSNIEGTCDINWNKRGTGILHEDIPFPILYVEDDDVQKLRDCFNKFNNFSFETQYTRSLCSLEIDTFMYATTDTPTCIRRSNLKTNLNPQRLCDPIGGENVWSSLFSFENSTKKNQQIIVAARIDSVSLINKIYPGAGSPVTGLVNLLATAELLKRMVVKDGGKNEKNVLFVLFSGESFDYMGSERFIYDMEMDQFPMPVDPDVQSVPLIHLDDITLYIELSQLSKSDALYVHMNENSPQTANFLNKFKKYSTFTKVKEYGSHLPPSSLQSFVKVKSNMSGIVIADYGEEYVNKFYNSIYDDAKNIQYQYYNVTSEDDFSDIPYDSIQRYVANISEAVARALFEDVMNKEYVGEEKPRLQFIDELFNCYLENEDCKIHKAIQRKTEAEIRRSNYGFYTGITGIPNLLTSAIGLTLGWVTGDIVTTNENCTSDSKFPLYQYLNISKSLDNETFVCYRTILNFTDGQSPAFIIEDYDWSSGKYSSWSESIWKDFSVRMFLKPSAAHERFTIAIGSVTFIMSLILVYFVQSRSDVLFMTPRICPPTVC